MLVVIPTGVRRRSGGIPFVWFKGSLDCARDDKMALAEVGYV